MVVHPEGEKAILESKMVIFGSFWTKMGNLSEGRLLKLLYMLRFTSRTFFFAFSTLKIGGGGGGLGCPPQGGNPHFGPKNGHFWLIFDKKWEISAKMGCCNCSTCFF